MKAGALLVLAAVLAGCGSGQTRTVTVSVETGETGTTTAPFVAPDPKGQTDSTCTYVLGNFTQTRQGYRFLADVTVRNTGNIGIIARVAVSWAQIGGPGVIARKTVRVSWHAARTVHFLRIATQDQIDRHQGAESKCSGSATIVDTFGEAH